MEIIVKMAIYTEPQKKRRTKKNAIFTSPYILSICVMIKF